ncbi:gamma-glutamyl-CDP-amidate hydrolase [Campylobacter troglodytis]|uniref:gamma-glutamyl-CDP-amidate hydrolase n=1 Tax=Campylobacter troglodytis TaxID=654363 RepID=UPI001156DFB1|nr:gamma-glutamyl-CDP-amidate hydrolase [Campylobacter troglodytis]TQR60733.1 gamma-glutamyl-gamma-aminobutyrate hydrolase [Campylobacter troglodytis]
MFIGITQRLARQESYKELREILAVEWGELFEREFKGFLPLPLCFGVNFLQYKNVLSGVILSGGNDLSLFNENEENLRRDEYEFEILRQCVETRMPVFGVCRGAQMISHFFGSKIQGCENHIGKHLVRDLKGFEFEVNSFHNYAITELGANLKPLNFASDESIEAFKHESLPIFAVMWHIERKDGLNDTAILDEFKNAILEYKT